MENKLQELRAASFAPMLYMRNIAAAIDFYKKAFDAIELRRVSNSDGSVHVAEMAIGTSLFRMHEEATRIQELSPATVGGTTVVVGLLVDDPDKVAKNAVEAGGTELSPVQDYDYGYRQGTIRDPFGHHWLIEQVEVVTFEPRHKD